MTGVAKGQFTVDLKPQGEPDAVDGVTLGRRSIDKVFEGDIAGTSKGEMLSAMSATNGPLAYVAIERVTGSVHGKQGTLVFQHRATMDSGKPLLSIAVVPNSGTGELAGISGEFKLDIRDGKHFYEFEYSIA